MDKILPGMVVTDLGTDDRGVVKSGELVIFIPHALPGDIVDIEIYRKKRNFALARITRKVQSSPVSRVPDCVHFGVCGGCKIQDMDYQAQLQHKEKNIHNALRHIGKTKEFLARKILASGKEFYYRNKLEFSFSSTRWLSPEEVSSGELFASRNAVGFHVPGKFDKILDINHCMLQPEPSNGIKNAAREYALSNDYTFWNPRTYTGFLRSMVVRTSSLDESMVCMVFTGDDTERINGMLNHIKSNFPQLTSLYYYINSKKNDSLYDLEPVLFHGQKHIREKIGDIEFLVGPKSFFQTNRDQAEQMMKVITEFAGLTGREHVYDIYSGVGTISLYLARFANKITGIETVEESVKESRENAIYNNITNVSFFSGEAEKLLTESFLAENGLPDVIVVDPPRAGLHQKVCDMLNGLKVPRLVYVSCNPSTQARDIAILSESYLLEEIQPLDMFPQTLHTENIALLKAIDYFTPKSSPTTNTKG